MNQKKIFSFSAGRLPGVVKIEPLMRADGRGYFLKSFERSLFQEGGIDFDVCECFETYSRKGVLRGLHIQSGQPQAKLVRAVHGKIFDVAVDLRRHSPTLGQWEGFVLDSKRNCALYIPAGFAHGFLTLSEFALVSYMCDAPYIADEDGGIIWNDTDIAVKWPPRNLQSPIVSPRDSKLPTFKEYCRNKGIEYANH